MGGHLIPPLELIWSAEFEPPWFNLFYNPIWIQFFHRWWAIAALLVVSLLPLTAILSRSMTTLGPAVSWLLRALLSVLVFQVLLGILTLITRVQPLLALLHLLTALLLSALLIALAYLLRGRKVVRS
jgi:heme A synthase